MNPPNIEKIVAVDFDKTICNSEYPLVGTPKSGVREALEKIRSAGYWVTIWSCRSCGFYPEVFNPTHEPIETRPAFLEMVSYLEKNGIPYDDIDDGTKGKVYAAYYIDDKGLRFNDNWDEIAAFIQGGNQ